MATLKKIIFKNGEIGNTPINNENLNKIQDNTEMFVNSTKEELEEELEALWNDFKPNTVSGESAIVSDGVKGSKVEGIGDGNSYQETTEGYNILPTDKNKWESGHYGTDGDKIIFDTRMRLIDLLPIEPSSTYYCLKSFILRGFNANKEMVQNFGLIGAESTFTTNADVVYLGVSTDITYSNYVEETDKLLICLNSVTNKTWEPYTNGASPNTEYEQPIKVIEAYNEIGKAELVTTDGGITLTNNKDGSFTLNGTSTKSCYIRIPAYIDKVGDYTVSFNNGQTISSFGGDVRFVFYNGNTKLNDTSLINKINYDVTFEEGSLPTVTNVWLNAGNIFNNFTFYPMVTKSKYKGKPYLPYGHIGLKQRGANRFDISKITENKYINVGNGALGDSTTSNVSDFIPIKAGETYSCKFDYDSLTSEGARSRCFFDINKNYLSGADYSVTKKGFTSTAEQDGYIRFSYDKNCKDMMFYDQAEKTDDTYEPYIEPIVHSIDLAGNSLAKVGEIKDLLNIGLDGSVSIENIITLLNLKSTLVNNWLKTGNSVDRYYLNFSQIADFKPNSNIMCNFFKYGNGEVVGNMTSNSGGAIGFAFAEKGTTEVADWLEFIENNDVIITLPRNTRKTIPLPSIEPIKLIEGITNVFELATNLGTTLSVTYKISNNSRLEALEKAILS